MKIKYNRVFGYSLEITNTFKDLVPDNYIRKQTLTNAERYITQELKELEDLILGAEDKLYALEYELFCDVRDTVGKEVMRIQKTAKAVAALDVFASLALVAERNHFVRPKTNTTGVIDIKNGRHPVVEQMIENDMFIANDTYLDNHKKRVSIITGPNMAGKSTYMRQTALIVLMAQIGSFVPAEKANIGIVDRIFTRVGASDDLASGQSTFMVEMTEVANILRNATARSLLILDEIGRGTSTFDGLANCLGCDRAYQQYASFVVQKRYLPPIIMSLLNWRVRFRESITTVLLSRKKGTILYFCVRLSRAAQTKVMVSRLPSLPVFRIL